MFNLNIGTCLGSLATGQSCNFSVTFAPTTAALKIASADFAVVGEPPVGLPHSGTGVTAFSQARQDLTLIVGLYNAGRRLYRSYSRHYAPAWGAVLPSAAGVTVNSTGIVNFIGGYDALFGSRTTGMTAMLGVMTILQGMLVVDGLTIQ